MQNNLSRTQQLRYNIGERMTQLERGKVLEIRRCIIGATKVAGSTYHRWLLLRKTATADIPSRVLRMFAEQLSVRMEELFCPD